MSHLKCHLSVYLQHVCPSEVLPSCGQRKGNFFISPLFRGNSADLACGVPGPVAQVCPSALLEPSEFPPTGMPDSSGLLTSKLELVEAAQSLARVSGPYNPSCACYFFFS